MPAGSRLSGVFDVDSLIFLTLGETLGVNFLSAVFLLLYASIALTNP